MPKEESKIAKIKAHLMEAGPLLPGSLTRQWNVCGTPGCQCKDPRRPRRHGPYYQLSYTLRGKSSTVFVKREDVAEVRRCIQRYRRFKRLCGALVEAYIESMRSQGMGRR